MRRSSRRKRRANLRWGQFGLAAAVGIGAARVSMAHEPSAQDGGVRLQIEQVRGPDFAAAAGLSPSTEESAARDKGAGEGPSLPHYGFAGTAAIVPASGVSLAQAGPAPGQGGPLRIEAGPGPNQPPAPRLNPTGRVINLTVPAKDGAFSLGDVVITIEPNDQIEFSPQRVLDLLANSLDQRALDTLRSRFAGKTIIAPSDFAETGITATYDPQTLELVFGIPVELKASRSVAVASLPSLRMGAFAQPANFSAYLNVRGSLGYAHKGFNPGLENPVFALDGAAWANNFALEYESIWQPGSPGPDFQRQGTRLVYDDPDRVVRWTLGDLRPVGQGFQSVPQMAGASVFRSYSVLQPELTVRPTGDQSFQLARPSTVEIRVNGQLVSRQRLGAGNYNLRDFPFSQGANDVTVFIEDDAGRQETLRFNLFFDQTQLSPGLSEFGLFAGMKTPFGPTGPDYTGDVVFSGFYRRGVSQELTLGGNFQADTHSWLGGFQGLWGSQLGIFGLSAAASHIDGIGEGTAATLTFQRLMQSAGGQGDSVNLAATARSRNFGAIDLVPQLNRYSYELSAAYSHAFNRSLYMFIDTHYSKGRNAVEDIGTYRVALGYRLTPDVGITAEVNYNSSGFQKGLGTLLSLTWSLSPISNLRGDYDSHNNNTRLSYQALQGSGVGSYNVSADIERTDDNAGFNGTGTYFSNRAELGLSHFTSFDANFKSVGDQRTAARVGTSIAFADGAVTIGRPVNQAFAIVKAHPSLEGAEVIVNPTPFGYTSSSDTLGTALETNLSPYAQRTITVDVPNAPQGYDIGSGSFRLFPPYQAGYLLQVGSDYSVTAVGRLLNAAGEPLALIAGTAIEIANPNREPVTIFTNGQGRFGASGLRPGRWRLQMPTEPVTIYILDVPEGSVGVVRSGDLKPSQSGN